MTGGAGFIGKYCVKSFLEKNYKVTIFDNFSNSSEDMISDLLNDGANLIKGDITIQDQVSNAISGHDVILHLAAKINVQDSIANPKLTKSVNVEGTKNLLEACKENQITNIIAVSSAAVYGDCKDSEVCLSENSKTVPISPYGESKLEMEESVKAFSKLHAINAVTLRFFNVYGKGQSPEYAGVITKFLKGIKKNQAFEVFGDGLETRDFVSIHDVVDSIYDTISKIQGKRGSVYNIATGKSISINDLAKLMISNSGKELEIIYRPQKKGEIRFSQADTSLAKKELGFFPKIELEEGIRNLMNLI
ncbi:MAG: NAD-dependent epimerase/dehydratase [Nitrosopumilales archaeon]|nr:MAG: NAD-dependent epimerase/dehydratase [Nitrosopumilales archaeon]